MSTPNTEQLEQELKKAIRERDDALALLGLYKINTQEHKETITKLSIERNELKEAGQNVVDYIESEHGKQTALVFETWYKVKGSNENNLVINRNTGSVNFSDK